ncbi:hypothetical protein TNCV_2099691 [Trichonephila clavipes]|nr:hypothetical protein TNCV_2099691 [Trichonephila clavipes]
MKKGNYLQGGLKVSKSNRNIIRSLIPRGVSFQRPRHRLIAASLGRLPRNRSIPVWFTSLSSNRLEYCQLAGESALYYPLIWQRREPGRLYSDGTGESGPSSDERNCVREDPVVSVIPVFLLYSDTVSSWCDGAIFQQDNAQPHTSRVSQDCLRNVTTIPWSASDLPPVEHI